MDGRKEGKVDGWMGRRMGGRWMKGRLDVKVDDGQESG